VRQCPRSPLRAPVRRDRPVRPFPDSPSIVDRFVQVNRLFPRVPALSVLRVLVDRRVRADRARSIPLPEDGSNPGCRHRQSRPRVGVLVKSRARVNRGSVPKKSVSFGHSAAR
jgi:hypothetical protein